jgi:hypothetical protein
MPVQPLRRPAVLVEHQPQDQPAFVWCPDLPQLLRSQHTRLTLEKKHVRRVCQVATRGTPAPDQPVLGSRHERDLLDLLPKLNILHDHRHSERPGNIPNPRVSLQTSSQRRAAPLMRRGGCKELWHYIRNALPIKPWISLELDRCSVPDPVERRGSEQGQSGRVLFYGQGQPWSG